RTALASQKRLVRRTDRALSRLSLLAALVVLAIACGAVAYVIGHTKGPTFLPDSVGSILPDPENRLALPDAARLPQGEEASRLEQGGSLRFRAVWIRIDLMGHQPTEGKRLSLESLRVRNATCWAVGPSGEI